MYLDVQLTIKGSFLRSSAFHKVDKFNISFILLTFPQSFIPLSLGNRVYAGQVLSYLRICLHLEDFIDKTRKTTGLLIQRGYKPFHLKLKRKKRSQYMVLLHKHNLFSARQISLLLSLCS